jgi:hypothetical protein
MNDELNEYFFNGPGKECKLSSLHFKIQYKFRYMHSQKN